MKTQKQSAESRGFTSLSWLQSHHSFSFGKYHNPANISFGALRVLNDDVIAAGAGFGTHPHNNMEIISLPLRGALAHADSSGGNGVIRPYEVQVMTAGSGIEHSEFNHSKTEPAELLQIWIFPSTTELTPSYRQKDYSNLIQTDTFTFLVAPNMPETLSINQSAWISLARMSGAKNLQYSLNENGHGVYAFVISGQAIVAGVDLKQRDALMISDTTAFELEAAASAEILLIEIPLLNKN